jgi:hypothetical protein
MGDEHFLNRREFTLEAALALLAGVSITVSACGDDPPAAPSPQPGNEVGTISGNHGHSAVVTAAQLQAGNALSLNIQDAATHPHTVQITEGDLQQIGAGQQVTKESSNNDAHTHFVTFN